MSLAASFLAELPPTEFAMAYGSGVFEQKGYKKDDQKMVDLIVSVADPIAWHASNLSHNPHHYSSILKYAGPKAVAWVQNELGAKLWFNTLVPATVTVHRSPHDATFKYGVISTRCLVDDLLQWRTLYLAGRLHKPVDILTAPTDLQPHLRTNLRHALSASLLMLPNTFSVQLLFEVITSLSYFGDFRMVVGENPRKIHNIVSGNFPGFVKLYTSILQEFHQIVASSQVVSEALQSPDAILHQDESVHARQRLAASLPSWLQDGMAAQLFQRSVHHSFSEVHQPGRRLRKVDALWQHLHTIPLADVTPTITRLLSPTIASVVGKYARSQAVKGIGTAGAVKSCVYAARKLAKMFR